MHASMLSYSGAQACADNVASERARCSMETRYPVDSHTAIYRCGLASLNDLRILMMCTT